MTVVENKWLEGPYAPIPGDVTATELEVDRARCPTSSRAATSATAPTRSRRSTRPPTTGSSATAWSTASASRDGRADWYRARMVRSTAVSEALGEEPAPGERHGGMDDRQHQRRSASPAARSPSSRPAAGPVELTDELDTVGPHRLRRHPAPRLHRPPQGRPRHRRPPRHRLPLGPAAPRSTS